jgi:predicted RNA-binding Zn ribbon-like protein
MKDFVLDGNDRCLDFLNTEMYEGDQRIELLEDFADIVDWLKVSGLIDSKTANEILIDKKVNKQKVLRDIRGFRSNIKKMIKEISLGKPSGYPGIKAINQILKTNKVYTQVHNHNGNFELMTIPTSPNHDPLVLIAETVVDLLTQKDLSLIKNCSDPLCTLLFYDESKNHTRRWCSMNRCGNRAKAAIHYKKVKKK